MRDEKGNIIPKDEEAFYLEKLKEKARKQNEPVAVEGASTSTISKLNTKSPISRAFRGERVPNTLMGTQRGTMARRRFSPEQDEQESFTPQPVQMSRGASSGKRPDPETQGLKNDIEKLNKTVQKLTVAVEEIDKPKEYVIPDAMMDLLKEVVRGLQMMNDDLSPRTKKQIDDLMFARCQEMQRGGFCKKLKDARGYT